MQLPRRTPCWLRAGGRRGARQLAAGGQAGRRNQGAGWTVPSWAALLRWQAMSTARAVPALGRAPLVLPAGNVDGAPLLCCSACSSAGRPTRTLHAAALAPQAVHPILPAALSGCGQPAAGRSSRGRLWWCRCGQLSGHSERSRRRNAAANGREPGRWHTKRHPGQGLCQLSWQSRRPLATACCQSMHAGATLGETAAQHLGR